MKYPFSIFSKGHGNCMLNIPERDMIDPSSSFAGEKFSADNQCQLIFGPSSRLCSYMPKCARLWCAQSDNDSDGCRTQHMPWADGTQCDKNEWCQKGKCVVRNREALSKVDGKWGPWSR